MEKTGAKAKKTKYKKLVVDFEPEFLAQIDDFAKGMGVSRDKFIEIAIRRCLYNRGFGEK